MKRIALICMLVAMLGIGISAVLAYQRYFPIVSNQATPTPIPTIKPTLIPSKNPTQIPIQTPKLTLTAYPSGVLVLSNYSWHASNGGLNIMGEVWNNTPESVDYVKIPVDYYDAQGNLLDTHHTYTYLDNALAAGDKTYFSLYLYDLPGWTYFQFENPAYLVGGQPAPNLTIVSSQGQWSPSDHMYYLTGTVRNDDVDVVALPKVIMAIYDGSGKVIGGGDTYLNDDPLRPGQTSYFSAQFGGDQFSNVTYRLQANGWLLP